MKKRVWSPIPSSAATTRTTVALLSIGLTSVVNCSSATSDASPSVKSPLPENIHFDLEGAIELPLSTMSRLSNPNNIRKSDYSRSSSDCSGDIESTEEFLSYGDETRGSVYDAFFDKIPKFSDIFVKAALDDELFTEDFQGDQGQGAYSKNGSVEDEDLNSVTEAPQSNSAFGSNLANRDRSNDSGRITDEPRQPLSRTFLHPFIIDHESNSPENYLKPSLDSSLSASSFMDLLNSDPEFINSAKIRSASPFPRPRASSFDLSLATAAALAGSTAKTFSSDTEAVSDSPDDDQLKNKITDELLLPLNLIDGHANEDLHQICENVGILILKFLSIQIAKIPATPSVETATCLLEQLGRVFTLILATLSPSDRLSYDQIIQKSLSVTNSKNSSEYLSFKIIRDTLILLMMDQSAIFDEDFLGQLEMVDILRSTVVSSIHHDHFDTIDNIRLLLNFPNYQEMSHYFQVQIEITERRRSDENFMTLKEADLPDGKKISIKSGKTPANTKSKKDKSSLVKRRVDYSKSMSYRAYRFLKIVVSFCWLNRIILGQGLLLAILAQLFFFRK